MVVINELTVRVRLARRSLIKGARAEGRDHRQVDGSTHALQLGTKARRSVRRGKKKDT